MVLLPEQFKDTECPNTLFELIQSMVSLNAADRPTATQVVNNIFFNENSMKTALALIPQGKIFPLTFFAFILLFT